MKKRMAPTSRSASTWFWKVGMSFSVTPRPSELLDSPRPRCHPRDLLSRHPEVVKQIPVMLGEIEDQLLRLGVITGPKQYQ